MKRLILFIVKTVLPIIRRFLIYIGLLVLSLFIVAGDRN